MEKKKSNAMDRISELPEPILHQILKFLPFKEVARTCVLSNRWEQIWRRYPLFVIDRNYLSDDVSEIRPRTMDSLENTLRNRHCNDIVIDIALYGHHDAKFVDRCVDYAIETSVKNLKLCFDFDEYRSLNYTKYNLPSKVLSTNSVEALELRYCNMSLPRTEDVVKLPHLKKLDLSNVELFDNVFERVLAGCPLLEELCLFLCGGFKTLELFGHEKLMHIHILSQDLKRVDIKLMNISTLSIVQGLGVKFGFNMSGCNKLKKLRLTGAILKCDIISELLLLECLYLNDCDVGEKLKISNPNLKRLGMHSQVGLVQLVKIETPKLALSAIDLRFYSLLTIREYAKFAELLREIHCCSDVLLLGGFYFKNEVLDAAEELRRKVPSPLFSCPQIVIHGCPSLFSIARSVDEFLWIFPHLKFLTMIHGGLLIICKFSYKKPLIYDGEFVSCCKSVPLLCWKQCIRKVEVDVLDGVKSENDSPTIEEHYRLEGAQFIEKIDGICRRYL